MPHTAGLHEVTFEAVSKRYGATAALRQVSGTMGVGLHLVLGPNGSGKSTLASIASTWSQPTRGTVRFTDSTGRALGPKDVRACMGWLGHRPGLYQELSATENLRFFSAARGFPPDEAEIQGLLTTLGLDEKAWLRPVGGFSRGMLQRVGLARALLHRPRFLILDEPQTGLDHEGTDALVTLIEAAAQHAIVYLVSHDPRPFLGGARTAWIFRDGRLVRHLVRDDKGAKVFMSEVIAAREGRVQPEAAT